MSDVILYLSVAGALCVILSIVSLLFRRRTEDKEDDASSDIQQRVGAETPAARQGEPRRVAGARLVRSRFEAQRTRRETPRARDRPSDSEDEDDDEDGRSAADDIVFPEGKIGTKKRRKLEMKAEKRAQREAELQDREEKKRRQALQDEERRLQDEREKQAEKSKEEEAKRVREEKARREHEQYLQLKKSFQVESEGFDEKENQDEEKDLLAKFVEYVKTEKVAVLEDLAVKFNLKTQDAIDRLHGLMKDGRLVGVIDDRGKFICITADELDAVARFVRQRGRVSIAELAEASNTLISLGTTKRAVEANG